MDENISGATSISDAVLTNDHCEVHLKFDLLEIILHGIARASPLREDVNHSQNSLLKTLIKMAAMI